MKKINTGALILISILLIAIAGVVYYVLLGQWHTTAYAAGRTNTVAVYSYADEAAQGTEEGSGEAEHKLTETGEVVRGSEIVRYRQAVEQDGVTYHKVNVETFADGTEPGDAELYMTEESTADLVDDTVLETEVYVRTPATIYEDPDSPEIASFAAKGTKLEVTGHDRLQDNGYINMYRVSYDAGDGKTAEGYVYGKYMTDTQESADAPYNEHGEYDTAKDGGFRFELYGGEAKDLDFYPYERTAIKDNEFCTYARAMYLNAYAAVHPEQ